MSAPQQTGAMQAATLRCPPNVFRERYTLSDFEVTYTYGEGPNWSVCAARCKWSSAQVVLQTYTEVGNLSGCMALALTAAHGLTNHPSFLPLYAVFRDVAAAAAPADSKGSGTGDGSANGTGGDTSSSGAARGDRIVMVYPGGSAQHPLDAGSPGSTSFSPPGGSGGGGGSGPPVSERGVVRGLLQPLSDLVAVLGPMGLRPPYVCGLDVWIDSPEAPAPGQALFMVPLLCHRWGQSPPEELLPAAVPYAAPYLRGCPAAAQDQEGTDEAQAKRWLSWSAAALVHCVLIGSPPPDKARKTRNKLPSAAAAIPSLASVPQLPPLPFSNSAPAPRSSMLMMPLGSQRPNGLLMPLQGGQSGASGSSEAAKGGLMTSSSVNAPVAKRSSGSRVADSMPLWLSDEAGDWFRRGLVPDCSSRAPLDEQMRHPWVSRHAVPRNMNGHAVKRESLGLLPRELHPLMLDVVPMGLTRPGREEVEHLMAEMAANEAPSAAKPALPWQVMEGPQGAGPTVFVEEFSEDAAPGLEVEDADERDMGVVERYEVAEEQKDDGTRVVEELRVVSGKPDGSLTRAAKALQAAMARRVEAGQWVMANPRGTTFDDIARQNQQRPQVGPTLPVAQRRISNGAPAPPTSLAARVRSPDPIPAPVATAGGRISTSSVISTSSSGAVGRNRSPGTRGSRASLSGPKAGKAAK
ncbi:hypothetical protein PLESTB_001790600 [Pleodorina starrii]|uniref:Uncharacterized protein n=1 Tax=Pleodorina starrii TaxID=330485 RepID=A0A9W6FAD3_9CHLO|nr:hypothetical protein PLESTM_001761100 [Pleodorina starrii]GLC61680.1 hypothetical protein PLESTB_001790600 [Pleodorina starrii]GLC76498.1 hypothetical protein PLESTF_001789300 [Pleodorina starrii]